MPPFPAQPSTSSHTIPAGSASSDETTKPSSPSQNYAACLTQTSVSDSNNKASCQRSTSRRSYLRKSILERRGLKLEIATWLDLFKKKNWRRTIIETGVAFFQQFSATNGFIYYAPILFQSIGKPYEMSLILSGALNIMQLIAVLCCFFITEHVGRRPLVIFGGFGLMMPYIIFAILVGLYSSDWAAHKGPGCAAVAITFAYIFKYGIFYSPLVWVLPPEIFSTSTRAKGVGLSTATVWLCNFIVGVAVPPMIENAGFGTYVFFACFCGLTGMWAYFFVSETKGKMFGDGSVEEEKKEMLKSSTVKARRRRSSVGMEDFVKRKGGYGLNLKSGYRCLRIY